MESDFAFHFASAIAIAAAFLLYRVILAVWWRPSCIKRAFERQGVQCLPYHLFVGNIREIAALIEDGESVPLPQGSNDFAPRIFPHYFKWKKEYGTPFVFWLGYRPVLSVADPKLIREILSTKFGQYKKFFGSPKFSDLTGVNSVAVLEGERWAKHRRIVSSAFLVEKLQAMSPTIVACITVMLDRWESELRSSLSHNKEADIFEEFKSLTADVIAHTAFGSSNIEGKLVSERQQDQQKLFGNAHREIYVPGSRFLPTARNRHQWQLKKEIESAIHHMIQSREQDAAGNDLLGVLMAAGRKELPGTQKSLSLSSQEIVDECKTFFFGGNETTANLMSWTTMLLAYNQEWQERTRAEVLKICGTKTPDAESLNSLKLVSMVLNEALRLYPPGIALMKESGKKEQTLGHIVIPPRTLIFIPIFDLHHDPTIWGQDALEFNPQRFGGGLAKACTTPMAFLPFSMGPRNCVGQNFAMLEARLILTMMLQRFRFSISPYYKHSPNIRITLGPENGMHIVIEMINPADDREPPP